LHSKLCNQYIKCFLFDLKFSLLTSLISVSEAPINITFKIKYHIDKHFQHFTSGSLYNASKSTQIDFFFLCNLYVLYFILINDFYIDLGFFSSRFCRLSALVCCSTSCVLFDFSSCCGVYLIFIQRFVIQSMI
jgi:hypothetical protein